MLLIRGTERFLKEAGYPQTRLAEPDGEGALGAWFANLLWFDRRKCVLFTHGETLYSFFVPGVRRADLADLGDFFRRHFSASLVANGFAGAFPVSVLRHVQDPVLARTNNRSVLGSMNDLALQCEVDLEMSGGVERCNLAWLNHRLNRVPMSAIGHTYAVERFRERFTAST